MATVTGTAATRRSGPKSTTTYARAPAQRRVRHVRTLLQQTAAKNVRRRWVRGVVRVGLLVGADIGVFLILRAIVDTVHAGGSPSDLLPRAVAMILPQSLLGGWQFGLALVISLALVGSYSHGDRRRGVGRLFAGSSLAAGLTLYHFVWAQPPLPVMIQFASTATVFGLLLTAERGLVDWMVRWVRGKVGGWRVIAVCNSAGDWLDLTIAAEKGRSRPSLHVVGVVHTSGDSDGQDGVPLDELPAMIHERRADAVLVCGPISDWDFGVVADSALVSGCSLLAASRTARIGGVEPRGLWIDGIPLIELTAPRLALWQVAAKRLIDIVAASVGLILMSPAFAMLAVLIRLDSPGPIFFRQWRVGRAGKPFEIFKFRSMDADAESRRDELRDESVYKDDRLFKVARDPRTTRLGRWLRKTSIDELPQLVNVLRGEMSLVGPRPPIPCEVALYDEHHYCRFDVKPGITGPWQVSGRNDVTDFEEVVRLESAYIRNWSVLEDLRILLRTIPIVLRMAGAH